MSAYELIQAIEPTTLDKLMSTGLLRSTVQRDIKIYEFYLNERKTCGYMDARTITAEKYCLSEEMISKIIQKMK